MPRHTIRLGLALLLLIGSLEGCGGGGGSSTGASNPAPTLNAISPPRAVPGSGAFTLTATGSNFVASSVVYWNGSARTTVVVSATQLTAQIMASDIMAGGKAQVTVVNPAPGGGTSAAQQFTITAVGASVQQLAPGAGAASSAHYQIAATIASPVYNSAASSAHYQMQGGLSGAGLTVP